jgi:hypothetical protein
MGLKEEYNEGYGPSPVECKEYGFLCSGYNKAQFAIKIVAILVLLIGLIYVLKGSGSKFYKAVFGLVFTVSMATSGYYLYNQYQEYKEFIKNV